MLQTVAWACRAGRGRSLTTKCPSCSCTFHRWGSLATWKIRCLRASAPVLTLDSAASPRPSHRALFDCSPLERCYASSHRDAGSSVDEDTGSLGKFVPLASKSGARADTNRSFCWENCLSPLTHRIPSLCLAYFILRSSSCAELWMGVWASAGAQPPCKHLSSAQRSYPASQTASGRTWVHLYLRPLDAPPQASFSYTSWRTGSHW